MALEEEFVRLPADIARFNEDYAQAVNELLRAKRHEERTYARVYLEEREKLGKRTEATVKANVELHEDIEQAVMRRIMAEVEKTRLRGVVEALSAKRDSLISIGAALRDERRGPPVIRED